MSLEQAMKDDTAAVRAIQLERDHCDSFRSLLEFVSANADGIADLGDTNRGRYALFANLLVVDGQPPSVVIEELEILKCPSCGRYSDLGDVIRAICLDDDGYAWRIDLSEEDEDLDLTDGEIALVCEAARRARKFGNRLFRGRA